MSKLDRIDSYFGVTEFLTMGSRVHPDVSNADRRWIRFSGTVSILTALFILVAVAALIVSAVA